MKSIYTAIIFILCINTISNAKTVNANEYKTFTSKNNDFSINYPKNWEIDTNTNGVNLIIKSKRYGKLDFFRENISLSIKKIPTNAQLDIYKEETLEMLDGKFNNFDVITESDILINNYPACKLIYSGSVSVYNARRDFKLQQLFIKKNNQLYILTYTGETSTWDYFIPIVNNVFGSLKFK